MNPLLNGAEKVHPRTPLLITMVTKNNGVISKTADLSRRKTLKGIFYAAFLLVISRLAPCKNG